MRGCIEEIFKRYNLSVLVESEGGKEEEGFQLGDREVRKRRVFSWVTGRGGRGGFSAG